MVCEKSVIQFLCWHHCAAESWSKRHGSCSVQLHLPCKTWCNYMYRNILLIQLILRCVLHLKMSAWQVRCSGLWSPHVGLCRRLRRWWGFPFWSIWEMGELIVLSPNSVGTKLRGMRQATYDKPLREQELSDAEIARKLQEEELLVSRGDALVILKQLRCSVTSWIWKLLTCICDF